MVKEYVGDIPLTGFFANGEIAHNRVYSYTGVLTLFL
jgi:small ligand-binding sensory domain FIST